MFSPGPAPTDSVSAVGRHLALKRNTAGVEPYMAVVPLADVSGFRAGIWDLGPEMARLLSTTMRAQPHWRVVDQDAVSEVVGAHRKLTRNEILAAGRILEADLVVSGSILDYDMQRITVGDPLLAGYKSYTGIAELQLIVLRVEDGSELGRADSRQESVNRGLGLDLLGRPRKQDLQLRNLEEMEFGSAQFQATPLGQATFAAIEDLVGKLARVLSPTSLRLTGEPARILSKHQEEVYINLGSENGLRTGYRFEVFPGPERTRFVASGPPQTIGLVEVIDVVGARLARVRVLAGHQAIEADDRLRPLALEGGPDRTP